MFSKSTPLIYLVDDDDDDRYLVQTILDNHYSACAVRVFASGADLLTHLTHQLDGRLPDLIILDLYMPMFNGFELLSRIKQNSDYEGIPVAIMSDSDEGESRDRCYRLGTNAYLTKTLNMAKMTAEICQLERYWSQGGLGLSGGKSTGLSKLFNFKNLPLN
ncbi:response regulator [Spirosoma rhododendri]|uniref:Response regulator n=1 Tax=Spirosoma rhododendri TaxID=2728024 RepID=A0A7L5DVP9_9BACT|nr:response regulator [Spirosoma rhododendri]QJD79620.1 response regulator [Spirosoma rhododendri]